jgi:hypothetical protein
VAGCSKRCTVAMCGPLQSRRASDALIAGQPTWRRVGSLRAERLDRAWQHTRPQAATQLQKRCHLTVVAPRWSSPSSWREDYMGAYTDQA